MRLFRIIGKKEKEELLINNSILKSHKTCKVEDWILYPHPEDYDTGKYFFFEIEDCLKYAKEMYGSSKDCSLLEINIDEKNILPYLGFGVYCYPDYENDGQWNNNLSHCIPEVLLPYQIVDNELRQNNYLLTDIGKRELLSFYMPYNKNRSQHLIKLGDIVSKICFAKRHCFYYSPENENCMWTQGSAHRIRDYIEAKKEVEALEPLLPPIYEEFERKQRNYITQISDLIPVEGLQEIKNI